jgi:hypothetical protein
MPQTCGEWPARRAADSAAVLPAPVIKARNASSLPGDLSMPASRDPVPLTPPDMPTVASQADPAAAPTQPFAPASAGFAGVSAPPGFVIEAELGRGGMSHPRRRGVPEPPSGP